MASMLINVAIVVGTALAWRSILLGSGNDRTLSARGAHSLKYYTVLSNLFSGAVSALYLLFCLLPGHAAAPWLLTLKLAATTTVTVTFIVTATLLGPAFGWGNLYVGGNFWMHLVLPILAVIDVCLFVPVGGLPLGATLAAVAFTTLYGMGYLPPILRYGAERDGKVYDFYGFLRWGRNRIWLVLVAMLLATWAIALVLRWANSACMG